MYEIRVILTTRTLNNAYNQNNDKGAIPCNISLEVRAGFAPSKSESCSATGQSREGLRESEPL